MINFIKMDIRRLFRSMSFYVILAIFMGLISIVVYEDYTQLKDLKSQENVQNEDSIETDEEVFDDSDDVNARLYISTDSILNESLTFDKYLITMFGGNNFAMFTMILVVMFISTEYQTGYIKNIQTMTKYRWYNIISKIVTGFVQVLVYDIIGGSFLYIAVTKIFPIGHAGNMASALKIMGIQLLVETAIVSLAVFIATVIRSKAFSITTSVLLATNMITLPFCFLVGKIFDVKPKQIFDKTLIYQMNRVNYNASEGSLMSAATISIVFLIIYTLASCYIIQKRDI